MERRPALYALALAAALLARTGRGDDTPEHVVRYADDRLTVHADKASVTDLLVEVGHASGAEIQGGILPHDVTAQFDDVPLSEGLHRLLGTQNFLLKYGEGGKLRAIVLLGGPAAPTATAGPQGIPPTMTPPQSAATLQQAVSTHPPIAVSGRLAAALGTSTPTVDQLMNAALQQNDPKVREEALRSGLDALEKDPNLRSAFLTTVNKLDDVALSNALRGMSAEHAEEFVAHVAAEAKSSELRIKASSVLQQLRAPHGG